MIGLAAAGAGACVALGLGAANRLNRREETLQAWENALLRMEAAIALNDSPLSEALLRGNMPALLELRRRLADTPAASPEELLSGLNWESVLLPQERDTLKNCLSMLFSPSLREQAQAIAYARSQWTLFRSACREARDKDARLYALLGWLGGAAVFILLC
ncbi:MAG: stage III sporulation protein AB [Clostridia bacterium]|nr:stage III sporulation protein AB [Clostridia bacterium]